MTFKLNDKNYISNVPTFGVLRQLEQRGINVNQIDDNMFSFISNYFSIMTKIPVEEVDIEISEHIEKYGMDSLSDLINMIIESLNGQGFSGGAKKTPKKTATSK